MWAMLTNIYILEIKIENLKNIDVLIHLKITVKTHFILYKEHIFCKNDCSFQKQKFREKSGVPSYFYQTF